MKQRFKLEVIKIAKKSNNCAAARASNLWKCLNKPFKDEMLEQ
jgi:hypothetical protein